ncbi:hypothetical protein MLD38_032173 [Melastoma candidum]|uniref:Uncharacterized protein n=1 Tax=Melastoma candidum TaxID=119954 RepID=A0ACB9M2Y5_9MYRT|nr:hypothetical protein MLD38_032173 [Melastoma candidum]
MEIRPSGGRHVSPPSTTPTASDEDTMHAWWESISKARSRIQTLTALLPDRHRSIVASLADSDRPALSLLLSPAAYSAVVSSLVLSPSSGSGSDPLCHWLYDTFLLLPSDPHLPLVSLSFLPLLSGLYLLRLHRSPSAPSLAGFEAVLLAVYSTEVKSREGKPNLVSIPDLACPSLYHSPRVPNRHNDAKAPGTGSGVLSRPLEQQNAVKSTKRASIVGTTLEVYYKSISQMPPWSKVDFCRFAAAWAGQECSCRKEIDCEDCDDNGGEIESIDGFGDGIEHGGEIVVVSGDIAKLDLEDRCCDDDEEKEIDGVEMELKKGGRIPLPWELLQPTLRILGHCLLAPLNPREVKDAASVAVRSLYARASHDLVPQAILATRSLIQLDNRAREAAKEAKAAAEAANAMSIVNTLSKSKKPEILLVSK